MWLLVLSALAVGSRASVTMCPVGCTCGLLSEADPLRARSQDIVVDCQNQGLTEIPSRDIACDIKRIEFSNNNIRRLTRNSFRGLQQLEDIDLQNNQIEYIEAGTFSGLPNLRSVNIVGNRISEMDERPFWGANFTSITMEVQGNPWYCDHQLRRTVNEIERKVAFSGIICVAGEKRRPVRNKELRREPFKGSPYELIEDRIRKRLQAWQIACWFGFAWIVTWTTITLLYFFGCYKGGTASKKTYKSLKKAANESGISSKVEHSMSKMKQYHDEYRDRDSDGGDYFGDEYPSEGYQYQHPDDRYPDGRYPDHRHPGDRYSAPQQPEMYPMDGRGDDPRFAEAPINDRRQLYDSPGGSGQVSRRSSDNDPRGHRPSRDQPRSPERSARGDYGARAEANLPEGNEEFEL